VPESDYRYADFEFVANYFALQTSSWGDPYQVYRVYTPGDYPYTPYTNSLILNKKVFVPITGSQWDDEALLAYQAAMPGYEIVGIMHDTWETTDALHCRAKGIADVIRIFATNGI
jgi:agmatine/peptidylarginine deiminase